ncbi:hypothetical protein SEA_PUPPER_51 [Gordonia phage Pupper]|uniref:Uncharacterized protein n=1 Tax=Gordonia phage Pupper TaxID=2571249 RepID=A0A4Y6EKG5_9CAUD|nr:hypothetical protein KHQ83_gp226 [Gordonia phage Pupper]QDF18537.1 hypothetical protein SEA_PUPPER_51 [Gordonia phage Pupper]
MPSPDAQPEQKWEAFCRLLDLDPDKAEPELIARELKSRRSGIAIGP